MKRIWLSKESGLFYTESGATWFRGTVTGLGRKEFALSKEKLPLAKALRKKDAKIAEILTRKKIRAARIERFEEVAQDLIAVKSKDWSKNTLTSAELQLQKHLIPWFNDHYPYIDEINEATWEEYIADQRKLGSRKLFNDCKHLRMVMKFAYQKGLVDRVMRFRDPDPERDAGKRLNQDEVNRLLLAASPALKLQILMAITMGMRKSEILLLAWDRIDMTAKTIHLRKEDTKIRKARTMGMSHGVYSELTRWERNVGPYVFASRFDKEKAATTNKTAWIAAKRRAGVRCRFHDLRHTFLTVALLERNLNPLHVAVYAGVSLQEIERTYLHPSVEDTRTVAFDDWGKSGVAL